MLWPGVAGGSGCEVQDLRLWLGHCQFLLRWAARINDQRGQFPEPDLVHLSIIEKHHGNCLVVWNMFDYFEKQYMDIYGLSSFPLTKSIIFQDVFATC
jgi:hypothetical protein